ncbi:hypothetical protein V8E55_010125 [Tylopilus felleus]|jgi:hypothetical protein
MVQIAPLLQAMSVTSRFTPTDSTSNGLAVRQSFNPGDLPPACQSSCQVINTMENCDSSTQALSCICASSIGSQLQQCMNCLVSNVPSVQSEAQSALDSWNQECGGKLSLTGGSTGGSSGGSSSGTVPAPTGGSSSSSSGSPFGKSGGAVGLAACSLAACIVAAFAGALMSL